MEMLHEPEFWEAVGFVLVVAILLWKGVPGMVAALETAVLTQGKPFLGICVGMQLLASWGREHGDHKGLGWIPGEVVKLTPADNTLKIPHMGWNELRATAAHALTDGWGAGAHAYFVHSYQLNPSDGADLVARAEYGGPITAIVARDTYAGTQFHPEKSQKLGLALIANFLKWKP